MKPKGTTSSKSSVTTIPYQKPNWIFIMERSRQQIFKILPIPYKYYIPDLKKFL